MKWIITVGSIVIILIMCVWLVNRGEVFSDAVSARLKQGMTTNEVLAVLGPPSSVNAGHKEYTQWVYTRPFLFFKVGLVYFDESNHLQQAYND